MRAGKRFRTKASVFLNAVLIEKNAEPAIFQLSDIEMPPGHQVVRPTQEDVARCLHNALTIRNPLSGMTVEFRAETFEHGCPGLLELKKQRRAIPCAYRK